VVHMIHCPGIFLDRLCTITRNVGTPLKSASGASFSFGGGGTCDGTLGSLLLATIPLVQYLSTTKFGRPSFQA
jgi:hypothetical protein